MYDWWIGAGDFHDTERVLADALADGALCLDQSVDFLVRSECPRCGSAGGDDQRDCSSIGETDGAVSRGLVRVEISLAYDVDRVCHLLRRARCGVYFVMPTT